MFPLASCCSWSTAKNFSSNTTASFESMLRIFMWQVISSITACSLQKCAKLRVNVIRSFQHFLKFLSWNARWASKKLQWQHVAGGFMTTPLHKRGSGADGGAGHVCLSFGDVHSDKVQICSSFRQAPLERHLLRREPVSSLLQYSFDKWCSYDTAYLLLTSRQTRHWHNAKRKKGSSTQEPEVKVQTRTTTTFLTITATNSQTPKHISHTVILRVAPRKTRTETEIDTRPFSTHRIFHFLNLPCVNFYFFLFGPLFALLSFFGLTICTSTQPSTEKVFLASSTKLHFLLDVAALPSKLPLPASWSLSLQIQVQPLPLLPCDLSFFKLGNCCSTFVLLFWFTLAWSPDDTNHSLNTSRTSTSTHMSLDFNKNLHNCVTAPQYGYETSCTAKRRILPLFSTELNCFWSASFSLHLALVGLWPPHTSFHLIPGQRARRASFYVLPSSRDALRPFLMDSVHLLPDQNPHIDNPAPNHFASSLQSPLMWPSLST